MEAAIRQVARGVAEATGTVIEVEYLRYYPATINTVTEAELALSAARSVGLQAAVAPHPAFTSEDFMLRERPAAISGWDRDDGRANMTLRSPSGLRLQRRPHQAGHDVPRQARPLRRRAVGSCFSMTRARR